MHQINKGVSRMSLKFEGVAKVGDRIKAFDHQPIEGRPEIYITGQIRETALNCGAKCFVVVCDYDTHSDRVGQDVYVPMETSFDFNDRVTKIN